LLSKLAGGQRKESIKHNTNKETPQTTRKVRSREDKENLASEEAHLKKDPQKKAVRGFLFYARAASSGKGSERRES